MSHLTASHRLPPRLAPLIGRERELVDVRQHLLRPEVRLLTLTGPPGVGKTRLAVEAAHHLMDNFDRHVFFVSLAPIRDPRMVLTTVARTLGIREIGLPMLEQLKRAIQQRRLLLVLDNFEHLTAAAAQVDGLLTGCPGAKVLATSRSAIHLRWEREFPVPPLELPDLAAPGAPEALVANPAVALFVTRARTIRPDFTVVDHGQDARLVAEICHRLDGLPLAIELAAARIRVLSPKAIHERLVGPAGLQFLNTAEIGIEGRHRTLEDAIRWSYRLLSPKHQILFRRLAAFRGGCTLDAAQAVCTGDGIDADALDGLNALVDHNLLQREVQADGQPRFSMLQTIREFALGELHDSDEADALRRRHATCFLALAEQAEPHMWDREQIEWLDRLDRELDNLRAALDWCTSAHGDSRIGLRLGGALFRFWDLRGYWSEGRQRVNHILMLFREKSPDRVRLLIEASYLAFVHGAHDVATAPLDEALRLARELNFGWGIAFALIAQGVTTFAGGQADRAAALLEESLQVARRAEIGPAVTSALGYLAEIALFKGEHAKAEEMATEGLALLREQGDKQRLPAILFVLGVTALRNREPERALRLFQEGLVMRCALGEKGMIAAGLEEVAWAAGALGKVEQAARLMGAAAALRESIGGVVPPIYSWRAQHEQTLQTLHDRLDENIFAAAWAVGEKMPHEAAIEEALSLAEPVKRVKLGQAGNSLTDREREITLLVARGLSNREIAATLQISRRTAESHIQHILTKLRFRRRSQIASWTAGQQLTAGQD